MSADLAAAYAEQAQQAMPADHGEQSVTWALLAIQEELRTANMIGLLANSSDEFASARQERAIRGRLGL